MKEFQKRLLNTYNQIIIELEQFENEHRQFLLQAEQDKNTPQNIVYERMAFARDNHRRLQIAKTEKESIKNYNFE